MTKWIWKGIKTGIKTTAYPRAEETASGVSPGRPAGGRLARVEFAQAMTRLCPTGALRSAKDEVLVNHERCVHCSRCKQQDSTPLNWKEGYEWAEFTAGCRALKRPFRGSIHIRAVDAGACGACLSEIKQISSPFYNMHRLGFFITPTPRTADILLAAGPLTEHMVGPLERTYEAMPFPKKVIAVGTCALSGGIFGAGFAAMGGISETIPVDIKVPGCPPPPLAVIHALLLAAGKSSENKKGGSFR